MSPLASVARASLLAIVALSVLLAPGATTSASSQAAPAPQPNTTAHPTVKLWATRQGMVGGRTANGHIIKERDRFVALPSRKVLSKLGGNEFQVRLSYNGRQVTAPVWDVGPWNTKDNFWDPPAERELFNDLPRFVPQALAAWRDGHNQGRDQFGRWVTFPVSIDIADGTFWDDLGMRQSDWVDVTFLWINAPSPPPQPSYPKVVSKPAPASPVAQPATAAEPPLGQRWYFAEGSTQAPFHTWLLLQNPHAAPAQVTLTYMLLDGATSTQTLKLAPTSRQSVFVNQVLPDREFSTRIDSDRPIFAERAMYFRQDGHVVAGVSQPEKRWCTADGVTGNGTDTWLLVQNPGPRPARANVALLLEGGGIVRHPLDLPPSSRRSLHTNLLRENVRFAACVESDEPVIVERATYLPGGGGSAVVAQPSPAQAWHFAEGSTLPGAVTTLALGNPTSEPATVELTYLPESGEPKKRSIPVPPMGRATVDTAADLPGMHFGLSLTASKPIVAERTITFGPGGKGAHSSGGAPATSKVWYLAEGSTAQPFQEYVLVANPGEAPAHVKAEFMRDDGATQTRSYTVRPRSRISIDVNAEVPGSALSVRISADQPTVAERSMYWDGLSGGSNTTGVPHDQ